MSKLKKFIKEPQIVSLCGLRRVGKTTILQKIIQDLLNGNAPDTILYFSFDDFHKNFNKPNHNLNDYLNLPPNFINSINLLFDKFF